MGKRTVAFLDILGFRQMVEDTPLPELARRYEQVLDQTAAMNKPFLPGREPTLFPNHPPGGAWCDRYIFSDSVILVSTSDDEASCAKLITYSWRLTQMLLASGMPVRGAIVYGDIYENLRKNIVLGLALTRAYELERTLQWIGAVIDPSVELAFPVLFDAGNTRWAPLSNIILRYPAPFKNGWVEFWTLNWRFNLTVEKGTRSLFSTSGERHIQEKVDNTLQYAKVVLSTNRAYVPPRTELPIELRNFFAGSRKPPFQHGDDL